jgi:hypothetical protein
MRKSLLLLFFRKEDLPYCRTSEAVAYLSAYDARVIVSG